MSDDDVRWTRLRIGGWLPSYDGDGRPVTLKPVGGRTSHGTAVPEPGRPAPAIEAAWTRARALSRRRRAVLAALSGLAVLLVLGVASIQRVGVAPATSGQPGVGAAPAVEPYWPAGPLTDGPSLSPTPTGTPSPSATGTAGPARGGKPAAPDRTASRGPVGITPAVPSPTRAAVSLTNGSRIGLEPVNRPGYRVRHRNFAGRIDAIGPDSSALDRADSTFTVRKGLAASACVSFESVNYPGYYLRHQNFALYLHRRDGNQLFAADATFCVVPGLTGQDISLRAYNYPNYHLHHRDARLYLGYHASRAAMTFAVRRGL